MPHLPNWQEFGHVGQEGSVHDVPDAFDSYYGKYKEQEPAVASTPMPSPHPVPFTITGTP